MHMPEAVKIAKAVEDKAWKDFLIKFPNADRSKAPSKPEFFSGFFFYNFYNCSLPARINSSLITRRSNMIYFIYYL